VQGSVARVGLLTTKGFRDVLEIGTQMRPRLYDLGFPKPEPLVPRELRLEARERVGPEGEVVVPLDPASVEAAAGKGYLHLRRGDTVSFVSAGGGGYGRARRRRSSGATGAG
jgi:N-methylhydantoinase A/oxoprolinase/acetone carboxylase beta subunit